jgi:uncharacterized membrane protein YesL
MTREPLPTRGLGWPEHPVNVMFANLAWFVLVLPLVTWLPATVALAHALDRWFRDHDDRMVRNVLAGWRLHWRRTLPLGLASTAALLVLAVNAIFLSTRPAGVATLLLGGTGGIGIVWLALHLWLVPVIARNPDLPVTRWLAESAALAVGHPLSTLLLLVFSVLLGAVLVGFWTFVPFLSAGLVVTFGLHVLYRATA